MSGPGAGSLMEPSFGVRVGRTRSLMEPSFGVHVGRTQQRWPRAGASPADAGERRVDRRYPVNGGSSSRRAGHAADSTGGLGPMASACRPVRGTGRCHQRPQSAGLRAVASARVGQVKPYALKADGHVLSPGRPCRPRGRQGLSAGHTSSVPGRERTGKGTCRVGEAVVPAAWSLSLTQRARRP